MAANVKRILVYLRKAKSKDAKDVLAPFSQCILEYFEASGLTTELHAELIDNRLVITDDVVGKMAIKIKHPPFCPIMHLQVETTLPPEIASRGINCGAAVILETGDGKVLLTRRAKHLRAFPGIWVPPGRKCILVPQGRLIFNRFETSTGGHIEENESFVEAGLREFEEETGIHVQASQCVGQELKVLALWESVYPPRLSHGHPKRHHVVVYLYGKLTSDLTSDRLQDKMNMQPEEVDACAWLDRKIISVIVQMSSEEDVRDQVHHNNLPETISATLLNSEKKQVSADLPLTPLLQRSGDKEVEGRVSTGTKFALEEWLNKYHSGS